MSGNGNVSTTPRVWTDVELATAAQQALDEFVERRLHESGGRYLEHLKARRTAVLRLFATLRDTDTRAPNPSVVRSIVRDPELFDALRYIAGPPVSEDDLGVLVTRRVGGLRMSDLNKDDTLTSDVLKLICRLSDPWRFPWIAESRTPTQRELRRAVEGTALLHATQSLQTERRGHGRRVEQRLEDRLIALGFNKITGKTTTHGNSSYPRSGKIVQPTL